MRGDEVAASALGVDVTRIRMVSFVASGAIAGLYGVLFAYFVRLVEPGSFRFGMMLDGLLTSVVGGFTAFFGPVVGGAFVTLVPELQTAVGIEAGWVHPFLTGALLLLVIVFLPGGIASLAVRRRAARRVLRVSAPVEPRLRPEPGSSLLSLVGVGKDYGGVHAVRSVDLEVRAGEIVGIIGPKGAGKTMLVNLISGLVEPSGGSGDILGCALGSRAHRLARAGVARTFQHAKLLDRLSVLGNVLIGTHVVCRPTCRCGD